MAAQMPRRHWRSVHCSSLPHGRITECGYSVVSGDSACRSRPCARHLHSLAAEFLEEVSIQIIKAVKRIMLRGPTHAYVSLAQVMKRVEPRPMPMGLHTKHAPQGHRQPLKQLAADGDETVPLINGGLAAKAMKGRQSIAQSQTRPQPKAGSQTPPALSMPDALARWATSRPPSGELQTWSASLPRKRFVMNA